MLESLPPRIGGRYRPIRLIGRGGMGIVYEVEHVHTSEMLALKVLSDRALASDNALERFRREARVPARIRSEHVVRVVDADAAPELGGAPYLVMELLQGADLRHAAGDAPLPARQVIDWLEPVARTLDKAHALGIIHRDLKPENLFLARRDDGTTLVKILDFGIAKMTLDGGPSTASDQFLGTPLFMAPEQANIGPVPVTARADFFSLGLIAYRLLTGRPYWLSDTFLPLVREVCLEPMPPPSERGVALGPAFDAWFARACNRDPEKRFETATAQIDALAEALALRAVDRSITTSTVAISAPSPSTTARRVPTTALAAAVLTASAAVVVGGWMVAARSRATPDASETANKPAAAAARATDLAPEPLSTVTEPAPASALPAATASVPALSLPAPSTRPPSRPARPLLAPGQPLHAPDPFGEQH